MALNDISTLLYRPEGMTVTIKFNSYLCCLVTIALKWTVAEIGACGRQIDRQAKELQHR